MWERMCSQNWILIELTSHQEFSFMSLHHPSIKTPDSSSIAQGPKEPDQEVLMIEVHWRVTFINYI
jgi:hypothetical protein